MSATPEQWAEAREAFEAGESARAVAARLDVSHTTVTRRARREGWSAPGGAAQDGGGARGARRVPARPGAPAEGPAEAQQPTRTDDLGRLMAGDQPPAWDLTNPEHQRRIRELTGLAPRPWAETERHLEELAEDQRAEAEAARPWLRRPRW